MNKKLLYSFLLLTLPFIGFYLLGNANIWLPLVWQMLLSVATYVAYFLDKRRAKTGAWRISESTLHALSLAGGWVGGWAAQQLLRHKTQKSDFQRIFWIIVVAHLLAWGFFIKWWLGY